MTTRTYGVLLVSFSKHSHQSSFVPLYQRHPKTEIVAVADERDIDPELEAANEQWARKLGVPYIVGIDEALGRSDVDIVSIGHEIERRSDIAVRSARAGKHLWIDKFLGATVTECDEAVGAVEASQVKAIVPSFAYGELVQQSRRILERNEIGDLLGLHIDIMFGKGKPRPISTSDRSTPFLPPGQWKFPDVKRELFTIGAYAVGLIQACCAPIAEVCGHGSAHFFPEQAAHGTEDCSTLILVDSQGRTSSLCAARIGTAAHMAGGPARAWLVGTKSSALVDSKRPAVDSYLRADLVAGNYEPSPTDPMQWHSGPPTFTKPISTDTAGLAAGLDDFVNAIDEDRAPKYSMRQARDLVEILVAGYWSIVDGEPVELPLGVRS